MFTEMGDKQDIRQLMKEQKAKRAEERKKEGGLNPQLVRYTQTGQILCKICNEQIKSESLFTSHCQTKAHLEAIKRLKEIQTTQSESKQPTEPKQPTAPKPPESKASQKHIPQPQSIKRKEPDSKTTKQGPPKVPNTKKPPSDAAKPKEEKSNESLPVLPSSMMEDEIAAKKPAPKKAVPEGFFDNTEYNKQIQAFFKAQNRVTMKKTASNSQIPLGFFDNSKKETARRYNADVLQQVSEALLEAEFQKFKDDIEKSTNTKADDDIEDEIKQQNSDQQRRKIRLEEIKQRAEEHRKKLEEIKSKQKQVVIEEKDILADMNDVEGEAEDFNTLFDWRSKRF